MSELTALLAFVIPAALGAAWSPFILATATDIVSQSNRSRRTSVAFLVGGVVALVIWALLIVSALWSWFTATARSVERDLPTLELILAFLLVVVGLVALVQWRRVIGSMHSASEHHHSDHDSQRGLAGWVVFGAIMQGRDVSSMVLYIAIVSRIAAAQVPLVEKFAVLALAIAIITAAFWLPMVAHISIPAGFTDRLRPIGRWIAEHGQVLTVVVAWAMAALLIFHALVVGD